MPPWQVDVQLRDVKAGLQGFTAAWKAWVGNGPVPVSELAS
jgi:hypothetical protein